MKRYLFIWTILFVWSFGHIVAEQGDEKAIGSPLPLGVESEESEELDIETYPAGKTSGNVGLVSDYIFRGHSLTNHQPALQGGIDWNHPWGFYVGAWGSNVVSSEKSASVLELDFAAGYNLKLWRSVQVSFGALYYSYFENAGTNSWAFPFRIAWKGWKAGFDFSPAWEGAPGPSWYVTAGWGDEIPAGFTLSTNVGYSFFSPAHDLKNYADVRFAISHDILGMTAEAALSFVDFEQADEADGPRVVLGISKSF